MPNLPLTSEADAMRARRRFGFGIARQNGSHVVLRRGGSGCVVPQHRELKVGTLAGVLRQTGVSTGEFIAALRA